MSIAFNACICTDTPVHQFIDQTVHVDKLIIIIAVLSQTIIYYIIVHIHIQPRDPCLAYPVTSYVFNISDDNGNLVCTINHMENTSVNINVSGCDLICNQVYYLTIEAINVAGSTPSEEILLCKSNIIVLP